MILRPCYLNKSLLNSIKKKSATFYSLISNLLSVTDGVRSGVRGYERDYRYDNINNHNFEYQLMITRMCNKYKN